MTPALSIHQLQYDARSHWSFRSKTLLHGLSLEVAAGETFGFLGHNGAGKTTTIKCILRLLRPTAGTVRIFDRDTRSTAARAAVGYLAEQPYYYDYLTVRETLELYGTLAGVPASKLRSAVSRALDLVKISGRAKSPLRTLSKGLTQRVGMAQAIIGRPKLLILDEPFSGLDPIGRKEFRDLLLELKKTGTTIFMASHILSDVEFLCDRVSILQHGRLRGVYSMSDIPRLSGGSYELIVVADKSFKPSAATAVVHEGQLARATFSTREEAERALISAIERHLHVESFTFKQGNLEDLFLQLVQFSEDGEHKSRDKSHA